jgi:hypothetical protein
MILILMVAGAAVPIVLMSLLVLIQAIRAVREDSQNDQESLDYLVSFDQKIRASAAGPLK